MSEPARQPIDLDEFERRLRGGMEAPRAAAAQAPAQAPASASFEDPLAELARLVDGARDPFAHPPARPRVVHSQPAPQPAQQFAPSPQYDEWQLRGGQGYEVAQEDLHPDFRTSAYGAVDLDAQAAANGYAPAGHYVPTTEETWAEQDHAWVEDHAQAMPPRRSRKAMYLMSAAMIVVLGGIGATFALRGNRPTLAEAPVIKAASGPMKVAPEQPAETNDTTKSASVLDKQGDKVGASKVVTSEEQPIDLSQVRVVSAPTQLSPAGGPSRSGGVFPEAIKVKTVSVRPDGTIIDKPEASPPPAALAMSAGATGGLTSAPVPPARPAASTAPATTASTPQPAATTPGAPKPAAPKATARVDAQPVAAAPNPFAEAASRDLGRPIPPKPVQTAAVEPQRPPVAVGTAATGAAAAAGGFAVQLAAAGSDAEARGKVGKIESQFASVLGGRHAAVVKGEANGKPVWRIRVTGMSREAATTLCGQIKDNGGACFVATN